jgi:hypothetical protein
MTDTWSADLADAEFARLVKETKVVTPLTRVLLVVLIAAAGFIGGVLVERNQQPAAASTTNAAAFRGGNNGAGNAAGGGPGGGATVGTITLIDGTNVYVTTAQGDVVKVLTNPQTTISVSKNGTLSDLDPAKTVVVQGATNADGTVTASQITQGGFGAFGGGGGRRGGGAGGTGGTSGSGGTGSGGNAQRGGG